MLKVPAEMTNAVNINHVHAHLRKKALQKFTNTSASNKETLNDVLIVFRRKYIKPESQATSKHKWHKLTFDPNTCLTSEWSSTNVLKKHLVTTPSI